MRNLILIFAVSLMCIGCVTAMPKESLQSQEVITISGMNKEQIFNKSNQWLAEKFGSANQIIQYKDLKEGKIIGKIVTTGNQFLATYNFNSTISIDIKDNKSRLSFQAHDVTITSPGSVPATREIYGKSEADMAKDSFKTIISSYQDYMLDKAKKNDTW